jgi:hypothetical protein
MTLPSSGDCARKGDQDSISSRVRSERYAETSFSAARPGSPVPTCESVYPECILDPDFYSVNSSVGQPDCLAAAKTAQRFAPRTAQGAIKILVGMPLSVALLPVAPLVQATEPTTSPV